MSAKAPILVLGWGNLSRGDDALGPLFVAGLKARLASDLVAQVEFLDDYQLQVEHALDLEGRHHVLFVDASLDCAAPFVATALQARRDTTAPPQRPYWRCVARYSGWANRSLR